MTDGREFRSEEFLETEVLSQPKAGDKLKLWLSAGTTEFRSKLKFARRPRIWMLTGLYRFKDASVGISTSRSPHVGGQVSSAAIGAVTGVPIGASGSIGRQKELKAHRTIEGELVWAAQYMCLNVAYMKSKSGGEIVWPNTKERLLPNVTSRGQHKAFATLGASLDSYYAVETRWSKSTPAELAEVADELLFLWNTQTLSLEEETANPELNLDSLLRKRCERAENFVSVLGFDWEPDPEDFDQGLQQSWERLFEVFRDYTSHLATPDLQG